jgi:tetrahydromethanopterin S-methyltransferase subunit D
MNKYLIGGVKGALLGAIGGSLLYFLMSKAFSLIGKGVNVLKLGVETQNFLLAIFIVSCSSAFFGALYVYFGSD